MVNIFAWWTLRRNLVHTTLPFTSKVGIYAVPYVFCHKHYFGRTEASLTKCLSQHKYIVFRGWNNVLFLIPLPSLPSPSPCSPLLLSSSLSFCTILISSHFCHVPIFLPLSFLVFHFPLSLSFLKTSGGLVSWWYRIPLGIFLNFPQAAA